MDIKDLRDFNNYYLEDEDWQLNESVEKDEDDVKSFADVITDIADLDLVDEDEYFKAYLEDELDDAFVGEREAIPEDEPVIVDIDFIKEYDIPVDDEDIDAFGAFDVEGNVPVDIDLDEEYGDTWIESTFIQDVCKYLNQFGEYDIYGAASGEDGRDAKVEAILKYWPAYIAKQTKGKGLGKEIEVNKVVDEDGYSITRLSLKECLKEEAEEDDLVAEEDVTVTDEPIEDIKVSAEEPVEEVSDEAIVDDAVEAEDEYLKKDAIELEGIMSKDGTIETNAEAVTEFVSEVADKVAEEVKETIADEVEDDSIKDLDVSEIAQEVVADAVIENKDEEAVEEPVEEVEAEETIEDSEADSEEASVEESLDELDYEYIILDADGVEQIGSYDKDLDRAKEAFDIYSKKYPGITLQKVTYGPDYDNDPDDCDWEIIEESLEATVDQDLSDNRQPVMDTEVEYEKPVDGNEFRKHEAGIKD